MYPSKCSWLLPTYAKEVQYARVKDIDFWSAKKLKDNLDKKIDSLSENVACSPQQNLTQQESNILHFKLDTSTEEMSALFEKLNQCKIKPVALSLVNNYADQFVAKSRTVPVVSDLFETENLDLECPDLLKKCVNLTLGISVEDINQVEMNTRFQS